MREGLKRRAYAELSAGDKDDPVRGWVTYGLARELLVALESAEAERDEAQKDGAWWKGQAFEEERYKARYRDACYRVEAVADRMRKPYNSTTVYLWAGTIDDALKLR